MLETIIYLHNPSTSTRLHSFSSSIGIMRREYMLGCRCRCFRLHVDFIVWIRQFRHDNNHRHGKSIQTQNVSVVCVHLCCAGRMCVCVWLLWYNSQLLIKIWVKTSRAREWKWTLYKYPHTRHRARLFFYTPFNYTCTYVQSAQHTGRSSMRNNGVPEVNEGIRQQNTTILLRESHHLPLLLLLIFPLAQQ